MDKSQQRHMLGQDSGVCNDMGYEANTGYNMGANYMHDPNNYAMKYSRPDAQMYPFPIDFRSYDPHAMAYSQFAHHNIPSKPMTALRKGKWTVSMLWNHSARNPSTSYLLFIHTTLTRFLLDPQALPFFKPSLIECPFHFMYSTCNNSPKKSSIQIKLSRHSTTALCSFPKVQRA